MAGEVCAGRDGMGALGEIAAAGGCFRAATSVGNRRNLSGFRQIACLQRLPDERTSCQRATSLVPQSYFGLIKICAIGHSDSSVISNLGG